MTNKNKKKKEMLERKEKAQNTSVSVLESGKRVITIKKKPKKKEEAKEEGGKEEGAKVMKRRKFVFNLKGKK